MLKLAWSGVRRNTGRYVATLVAIMTGVAFFAATGFISDRVIDSLEGDVNREYAGVDVAVVAADAEADPADAAGDLRLAGAVAEEILAVDGVEAGAGILTGTVAFLADDGSTFGDGATGRLWIQDEELNPLEIVDGAAPESAGDITIDRGLADDESLAVGRSAGRSCSSRCCPGSASKASWRSTTRPGTRNAPPPPRTRCSSACSSSHW